MSRSRWRTGAISELSPRTAAADAAQWHTRLADDPREATRAAFERWLDADEAHRQAYARVCDTHDCARAVADHPALLSLRHETVARLAVAQRARSELRRRAGAATIALLVLGAPLAGLYLAGQGDRAAPPATQLAAAEKLYRTDKGQQMSMRLDDGSRVTLNTDSRVRVAYSAGERRLVLERGQAWFEVAKGQRRPFRVIAGDRQVTAHGTAFDVRLDPGRIEVVLVEGKVSVGNARDASDAEVAMRPDDVLTATRQGVTLRHDPDADQRVSWRDGLVVFANDRLADAVTEMNRYAPQPIRLADARTGDIRVSGAFRTGESAAFVEALELGFAVRATRQPDGSTLLQRR